MRAHVLLPLWTLISVSRQAAEDCMCELKNSEGMFPHDTLEQLSADATSCTSNMNPQQTLELQRLLLGLERRLPQVEEDVALLEQENDGELYGVLSLHVIENEMLELQELLNRLNRTTEEQQKRAEDTAQQVLDLTTQLKDLETFDTLQLVQRQQANQHLRRDLDPCVTQAPPTTPPQGSCPLGALLNVTGPRIFTAGEYPGSFKYGSWGRDPRPEAGTETWYWRVMLTSGNKFANYVRLYSTLSALIVGMSVPGNVQIHSSNPTTNTIQGPNAAMFGGSLYYNCYNRAAVCRFNLANKTVKSVELPEGARFNSKSDFCHLDECYPFTDLDLATDESGVWVIYTTTQDFGNLVLTRVEGGEQPLLGRTWRTSVYKRAVTNTFVACGVLYATRYVNKDVEEIFYSLDTATGRERFDVGIHMDKMAANVQALNYSPTDHVLHAYSDANMLSYKAVFERGEEPEPRHVLPNSNTRSTRSRFG